MSSLSPSIVEVRLTTEAAALTGVYPEGAAMVPPDIKPGPPCFNGRYQLWDQCADAGRIDVGGGGGSLIRVSGALGTGATDIRLSMVSNTWATGFTDPGDLPPSHLLLSSVLGDFQPPNTIWDPANFSWAPREGSVFVPPGWHLELTCPNLGSWDLTPRSFMVHMGPGWGNQVFQGVRDKI